MAELLKGATLVDFSPPTLEIADLRIDQGGIVARGPDLAPAPNDRITELGGKLIVPGLVIAHTRLPLTKGTWEFGTLSDDGVRVIVDGKPVIEHWAWHGPTSDTGKLTLPADQTVEIVVEHFQIDGYAVLELSLSRQAEPAPEK